MWGAEKDIGSELRNVWTGQLQGHLKSSSPETLKLAADSSLFPPGHRK